MRTAWLAFICLLSACAGADGAPGLDGARGPLGAMGLTGMTGPMGERGPAGPASAGYRPVFWVGCGAVLDLIRVGAGGVERAADGVGETKLNYTLLAFSNGDAEVQCTAAIGTAQDGSSAMYFPSTTKGAESGGCAASADFPGGTNVVVGVWSFDVATGSAPRAAYVDSDNPLGFDGYTYKYSESDCHVQMMSADGKWTLVTLSDVF